MKITINKALALDKMIKERANDLKRLRSEVAVKKVNAWVAREVQEETIPQYDVRELDRKILQLQRATFEIDAAVKESNASHAIEITTNIDELLTPLV